jgi:hypothetical protein
LEDNIHISFSIDTKAGIVTLDYSGDPSFDEWASTMEAVLRDAAFRTGYGILIDRSHLKTIPETQYIRRVVEYVQSHESLLGDSRVAILISSIGAYGMVRMSQILFDDLTGKTQAFTDRAAALKWLHDVGT